MWIHSNLHYKELKTLIRSNDIQFGGNARLKIYGTLSCSSGKRMKIENRVFFKSEEEAVSYGFRPCKKCMKINKLEVG
jgi:methylphosphotriester-DNA--protein-cysteine methyltransferase